MNKSNLWRIMAVVLALEGFILLYLIFISSKKLIPLLSVSEAHSFVALQISILIALTAGLVWVIATFRGATRQKTFARAANITIQVLFAAGATGVMQGIIGQKSYGLIVLVLAIVGFVASLLINTKDNEDTTQKEL